jgi:acetylornithine deacetylase/succinyl-diaminopimelate desuccinylase-like protein
MTSKDTARYHGDNERIGIEDYNKVIQFYYTLIKNADSMEEISTIENEEL